VGGGETRANVSDEAFRLIRNILADAEAERPSEYAAWREHDIKRLSRPVAAALRQARADGLREAAKMVRDGKTDHPEVTTAIAFILEMQAAALEAGRPAEGE
jgi:hypothetical protein